MIDPMGILADLRRPRLLIRAAHLGQSDYCRNRSLRRLLPDQPTPPPGQAFHALLAQETALELARTDASATYSFAHHTEVLIALLCEARLAACREAA